MASGSWARTRGVTKSPNPVKSAPSRQGSGERQADKNAAAEKASRKADIATKQTKMGERIAKGMSNPAAGGAFEGVKQVHAEAAASHDKAAKAQEHAGNMDKAEAHRKMRDLHEKSAAGDEWDEGKHPRDDSGKFA